MNRLLAAGSLGISGAAQAHFTGEAHGDPIHLLGHHLELGLGGAIVVVAALLWWRNRRSMARSAQRDGTDDSDNR